MTRKKRQVRKRGDTIKLIVKSNELVEAKYMFDIWETRFFHALVAMIDKNDEDERIYRVWFKDVKRMYKIKSHQSYSLLREAARSLNRKPVYIGWQKDEFKRGREYNLFEFVDFLEAGQSGAGAEQQEYVDIKIHSQMRPFLLYVKKNFDPKATRYTSYELRNIEKLQPYGTRIYELFKQFEYRGFRVLNIKELKDRFLITDEYPKFSTLYQRVIIPSIKAINKHTDITIPIDKIDKIKEGRRVVGLRCIIESKTNKELAVMRGETLRQASLFENLVSEAKVVEESNLEATETDVLFNEFETTVVKSFGVTPSVFLKMLHSGKYKREAIAQAINVTRRAKYQQEIKKNVAGFFLRALKDGYTDAKEEAHKSKTQKQTELKMLQRERETLTTDFSKVINQRIREITTDNEVVTQKAIEAILANPLTEALVKSKEASMGRKLEVADYRKDERLRAMVINNIIQMQQEHFEDILKIYQPRLQKIELDIQKISK